MNRKPDGWYLPKDRSMPAIILETKSEKEDLSNRKWVQELFDNIKVVDAQYEKIIGILYNGQDIRVFKYYEELTKLSKQLQSRQVFLSLNQVLHMMKKIFLLAISKMMDLKLLRIRDDRILKEDGKRLKING